MSSGALTLVVAPPPTAHIIVQPTPVFGLVVSSKQGPAGAPGPVGPAGVGAYSGGAGIRIVGSEIRLSIGTLPQL